MRRPTRELIAPPLIAAFVFSGCLGVAPQEVRTEYGVERMVPGAVEGFGYFSAGVVARADLYGEIDGIEPGTGWTATLPLAPGTLYVALVAVIVVAAAEGVDLSGVPSFDSGTLDEEDWHSGMSDPARIVISELSFDFTFTGTHHRDSLEGGDLDYFAFLVGMRLGGPRRYVPRYYGSAGWGWYAFRYGNRTNADVHGPYIGGGLELFANPGFTAGLDYKVHYYLGDDDEGDPVEGACGQASVNFTWYW